MVQNNKSSNNDTIYNKNNNNNQSKNNIVKYSTIKLKILQKIFSNYTFLVKN